MAWGPISVGGAANANGYTLPAATADILGGVKTGSNITNNGGTISMTKANVLAALGYTPANANHTHDLSAYLKLSGGTLTGPLTFANNTWNVVGDDAAIGDFNAAGTLGIKGMNGTTAVALVNKDNNSDYATFSYAGGNIVANKTIQANITGSANSAASAAKLDSSAGSATQPVYISGGKPVACSYTLGKSVPSNAVFTDTNTWRGIQNNLTSTATDQSLSAAMGKWLNDNKAAANHTHSAGTSGAFSGVSASGSNYVRFSDGTQICWGDVTSNGYPEYKSVFAFPVPFKDTNYAVSGMNVSSIDDSDDNNFYWDSKETGRVIIGTTYSRNDSLNSSVTHYIYSNIVAVGRWK